MSTTDDVLSDHPVIDPDAKDAVVKMDAAAKGQEALAMVKQYVKQAQASLPLVVEKVKTMCREGDVKMVSEKLQQLKALYSANPDVSKLLGGAILVLYGAAFSNRWAVRQTNARCCVFQRLRFRVR